MVRQCLPLSTINLRISDILLLLPIIAPSSFPRKRMRVHSPEGIDRPHSPRRTASVRGGAPSIRSTNAPSSIGHGRKGARLSRNVSQISIPISAIISPRAPSLHRRPSSTTRGHDALKNKERQITWEESWQLDRSEMPLQAWLFLVGLVFPFAWWLGSLWPISNSPTAGNPDEAYHESGDWSHRHRRRSTSATVTANQEDNRNWWHVDHISRKSTS